MADELLEIPETYRSAHRESSLHRDKILASEWCGCFYCRKVFPPAEIQEWADDGQTALCPRCGIDAVLPQSAGADGSVTLLQMQKYWFPTEVKIEARPGLEQH